MAVLPDMSKTRVKVRALRLIRAVGLAESRGLAMRRLPAIPFGLMSVTLAPSVFRPAMPVARAPDVEKTFGRLRTVSVLILVTTFEIAKGK